MSYSPLPTTVFKSNITLRIYTTQHQEDKQSNLKNGQRTEIETSPKETQKQPIHIGKKCSTSLIIREMQIKTIMRPYLTPAGTATINKSSAGKDVEKREP